MEKGARRDDARKEGWMGREEGFNLLIEKDKVVKDLEEAEVG